MNEITLQCADTPDAPVKNFLATLSPISSRFANGEEDLPFEITLDRYTRDSWSLLKSANDKVWKSCWFKSIDDKRRLRGFLQFLKGRKKAAFGKFESPLPDETTGEINTAIFLVPFDQPSFEQTNDGRAGEQGDYIFVKYCLDERKATSTSGMSSSRPAIEIQKHTNHNIGSKSNLINTSASSVSNGGGGLLGNLLGATQRTNQHLDTVRSQKKSKAIKETGAITWNQVVNDFRGKIEKQLLDFRHSTLTEMKLLVNLAEMTRNIQSLEEKSNVTMKVLEFIVFESVEEINEEWTPYKQPSEFMDECTIVVYKVGHVPPEVQDDLNRGEIPDELRQEQRALREAMSREEKKRMKMMQDDNLKKVAGQEVDVSVLNTEKRDRRTIEEIQKDILHKQKRVKKE
mmetsp:Transcript_12979/g.24393  ORF Transcript_12979/g.24393 Transcript_12979/m.24393 type:complete len:401 (-) Transcript_12979:55-1257(-)